LLGGAELTDELFEALVICRTVLGHSRRRLRRRLGPRNDRKRWRRRPEGL
jgi:hypothetical protein